MINVSFKGFIHQSHFLVIKTIVTRRVTFCDALSYSFVCFNLRSTSFGSDGVKRVSYPATTSLATNGL